VQFSLVNSVDTLFGPRKVVQFSLARYGPRKLIYPTEVPRICIVLIHFIYIEGSARVVSLLECGASPSGFNSLTACMVECEMSRVELKL
jgi:hypothetical protein